LQELEKKHTKPKDVNLLRSLLKEIINNTKKRVFWQKMKIIWLRSRRKFFCKPKGNKSEIQEKMLNVELIGQ